MPEEIYWKKLHDSSKVPDKENKAGSAAWLAYNDKQIKLASGASFITNNPQKNEQWQDY